MQVPHCLFSFPKCASWIAQGFLVCFPTKFLKKTKSVPSIHRCLPLQSSPDEGFHFSPLAVLPTAWEILSAAQPPPPPSLFKKKYLCWWKDSGCYGEWNNNSSWLEIVIWLVTLRWNSSKWKTEPGTWHVGWQPQGHNHWELGQFPLFSGFPRGNQEGRRQCVERIQCATLLTYFISFNPLGNPMVLTVSPYLQR